MSSDFAVLFDWDGVVVDSSLHHELSWKELAQQIGKSLTHEQFRESFGQINRVIIPHVFGWTTDLDEVEHLGREKERLYREIIRREGLTPLPGIRELLQDLARHDIPCVVGTSTEKENIRVSLEVMGLSGFFQGVVASEDVTKGKPDPEVFLKAAALAGMSSNKCVVLEDSHHGLEAARIAGMKTVALLTTHPQAKLEPADCFVEVPADLNYGRLRNLFL